MNTKAKRKNIISKALLAVTLLTVLSMVIAPAAAQITWSSDIRLTDDPADSKEQSIAMDSSGNVHIAWYDKRDGNYEIYYTKLDNAGATLVDDTRLTDDPSYSWYPDIATDSNDNIHIAWRDKRDGNDEIYYTKLNNTGYTLVDDTRLTSDTARSYQPSIVVDSNGNIHIAWRDNRDGNYEIYYTKLNNTGYTLVDDTRLTDDPADTRYPDIAADSNDNIHIAWYDKRDGNFEIYYTKLNNTGYTLVDDTRLTDDPADTRYPDIAADSNDNIHIAWYDKRDGNFEIYYTKLNNTGYTLVDDTRLTDATSDSKESSIAVDSSDNVHIAWYDRRAVDANMEIYYTQLNNTGYTLVDDTRLTDAPENSNKPSIAVDSNDNIHIAWHDKRDGGKYEIYYKKGGSVAADLELTEITTPAIIFAHESNSINATIENIGGADASSFNVSLSANGSIVDKTSVDSLSVDNSTNMSFSWTPALAGDYELCVIADCDNDVTESKEENNVLCANVTVWLRANVTIKPETLNIKSNEIFTAFTWLPEGYTVSDVDGSTVVCGHYTQPLINRSYVTGAPAVEGYADDEHEYISWFNRQDLKDAGVPCGDAVTLTVTGELEDGTPFLGTDAVRIIHGTELLDVNGTIFAVGPIWTAKPGWDVPDVGKGAHPAFVDIDDDGDYDLFVGEQFGISFAYENTGSESSPIWTAKPCWDLPDLLMGSKPAFADLDNDGDYDVLIGEGPTGATYGYENTGNASSPNWTEKPSWNPPTEGWMGAKPALADLDGDGDYDLLIYKAFTGNSYAYENTGNAISPIWTRKSSWDSPNAGQGATPDFADLDDDGDYDLLVGERSGATSAYENTGGASSPIWTRKTSWDPPNVAELAAKPALADLDNDGDYDLLIGTMLGVSRGYENTAPIPVDIDIKPGSCPNALNPESGGVLPVAVLGTAEFDVTTIDPETILLNRSCEGYVGVAPICWSYEDVATPFTGELCDCHDLNGDGYMDLTLKFDTQELVSNLKLDEAAGATVPLVLTGNLNGENCGTPIRGKDCIRV